MHSLSNFRPVASQPTSKHAPSSTTNLSSGVHASLSEFQICQDTSCGVGQARVCSRAPGYDDVCKSSGGGDEGFIGGFDKCGVLLKHSSNITTSHRYVPLNPAGKTSTFKFSPCPSGVSRCQLAFFTVKKCCGGWHRCKD